MSYRRSYGGYRRSSYGGRRKSSGARVRRSLKAQIAGTVDTLVTSSLTIPVDSTRNVGINVHELLVERDAEELTGTATDGDYEQVWLNRNTPSALRHVSDVDFILGWGRNEHVSSKVGVIFSQRIQSAKAYPPIPIFQDEIRLCSYNHLGTACTYYCEVVYTLAWMSVGQIMGIAKNIII